MRTVIRKKPFSVKAHAVLPTVYTTQLVLAIDY